MTGCPWRPGDLRPSLSFEDGETVLLRPPHDRPANKLAPRALGPFVVTSKTGTNTYKIHPFTAPVTDDPIEVHAERLIKYTLPDGAPVDEILATDVPDEYLVEGIIEHQRMPNRRGNRAGAFKYKVKWTGYDEHTWETSANLKDNAAFEEYLAAQGIRH